MREGMRVEVVFAYEHDYKEEGDYLETYQFNLGYYKDQLKCIRLSNEPELKYIKSIKILGLEDMEGLITEGGLDDT